MECPQSPSSCLTIQQDVSSILVHTCQCSTRKSLDLPDKLPYTPTHVVHMSACRTVQAIALDPDLHFRMVLQPGDIQWVHNTTMMHTR